MNYAIKQTVKDIYNSKRLLVIEGFGYTVEGKLEYFCSILNEIEDKIYGWVLEEELTAA